MFDPRKKADHAKKVFDEVVSQSSLEHGSKATSRQIHEIILAACDGKLYKVQAPVYNAEMPGVTDPELLKALQASANKATFAKYSEDVNGLVSSQTAAYHWVIKTFVGTGTPMFNRLLGHTDFKGMIDTRNTDVVRLMRAIKQVLITNPGDEENTPLNESMRQRKAMSAVSSLSILDYKHDFNDFVNEFNQRVSYSDSLVNPAEAMTEIDKVSVLLIKLEADEFFRSMFYDIKSGKLTEPKSPEHLFGMMRMRMQEIGSYTGGSRDKDASYVLHTGADKEQQRSKPRFSSRKPGVQKDGRIWLESSVWADMSAEDRKKHGDRNAVLKSKKVKVKEENQQKKALLATSKTDGEFSDDDSPYGAVLMVASSKKKREQQRNKVEFDRHMRQFGLADITESRDSDSSSDGDSDSSSSDSSSDYAEKQKAFDYQREAAAAAKQPPRPLSQRDHMLTREEAERLAKRAADLAVQSYIEAGCITSDSANHNRVIGSEIGVTIGDNSTMSLAQNCVDEIPLADIFGKAENSPLTKSERFTPKSKGFSSLQSGVQPEVQEPAGGTGILSHLSWLVMVILVIAAYTLGAVRNGGAAAETAASFPALPRPPATTRGVVLKAAGMRDQHVLMATNNDQRSVRFNHFDEKYVVYDPGSMGYHLFKSDKYLCNIVECEPGSIGGINRGSKSLNYSQCGTIVGTSISNVVLCPGAIGNILCPQSAMEQGYEQEYATVGDYYTLTHTSSRAILKFGRVEMRNGRRTTLYLMDLRTHQPPIDSPRNHSKTVVMATATVSHNKSKYTKGEVMRADKAKRFMGVMGNPPMRVAIEQIRSMRNAPVSDADIKRCIDIYGPSVASIKGHTVKTTTQTARNDTVAPDEVPIHVFMEVDVMFVKGLSFLVSISPPLDYAMCFPLRNGRGAAHLEKGLKAMVARLKSRNFVCDSMRSDNEGGIAKQSTAEEIQRLGIELALTGSGQHCAHVERRIRFIKEKYRALEHGLPFAMNKILVTWAVLGSTRMTNMQRTSSSTSLLSPREKFMGRPFDFNLDGRVEFGSYIQLTVRDTNNTSSARTEGCIALFSRDNLTGSIYAFHIATRAIVVRDQFTELPVSDAIISFMDKLAKKDGFTKGSEPFAASEYGAPDDDEFQNNDTDNNKPIPPFKPFNEPTTGVQQENQRRATSDNVTFSAGDPPMPEVPSSSRGAATPHSQQVTVEDVEDEDESSTVEQQQQQQVHPPQQQLRNDEFSTYSGSMSQGRSPQLPPLPTTRASGAQLFRGRGAAQTNSLAGMTGSSALLVGEDFNNPVFESKFKAQLHHTREWRDRDFAFVISWKRAIKTYGEPATASIMKELQQFIDKGVWHPVSFEGMTKEQRKAVIRAKMFVTEKFFPNGGFDKIKSRLVARGDMQDRSLYGEDDTSAPTAELSSVFSIAAIAACESRYVATCDIGGAFLNADMFKGSGRTVIVKLDPHITKMLTKLKPDYESFVGDDGHLFVELDKAMYGCIESAKLWYEHLRGVLVNDMGFVQNQYDQCTFNKTDSSGTQVTVILHVDDMKITCANKITLDGVLLFLCQRFKETKCHYGPCVPFLGMDFDYSIPGEVRITMLGMEADILATSGVNGVAKTPATETLFDVDTDKQPVEEHEQDWFRSNVAKLLYLGKRARPEILTATTFLATRAAKADSDDIGKLRRVIRYLRGSAGRGIRLCPGALGVSVRAYVDAAYGVHMDGKSHTGVSIVIGEAGPIFVRSTKQPIVAKSSTEAELVATSDSANQVFHVRNFIIEQGYGDKPATIFQDNMSCMALLAKGKSTSLRTRHIQIRYFWVKERVDNGEAIVVHMKSEAMGPANALTKPLVGAQFVEERRQLTNWD